MVQRTCSAIAWMVLLSGWVVCSAPLRSQTAPAAQDQGRVFKTSARIVVLDVVVTGKNHRPLTGLQQQDFKILEDGHPQSIRYFEEHTSAQPLQATLPSLPPNVFTNIPQVKTNASVTVLVLDSLNTPLDDQRRVHAQILKYLKKPQPGRIAIFALGTQLRLIQGFTDDPALLAAALNERKKGTGAQVSPLLQSSAETASTQEAVSAMLEEHAVIAAAQMEQFMANQSSTQSDARLKLTLAALQQLAHYLGGFPGRKNVVWFSGAFPVAILPDPGALDHFGAQRDEQSEVRKTDALLAAAQMALYPVGAEGVVTDSLFSAGADSRLVTRSELSQSQGASQERNADHAAMDVMAKETGGQAIYGTNSLLDALDRVAAHGSNFYTLTYATTNPAADGQFRKIQVNLNRSGYQLDYRRGYFAGDAKSIQAAAPKPGDDLLSPFLRPGKPESTQIPFTVRVTRGSAAPRAATTVTSSANAAQGGDNTSLKGPLTHYAVDLMIPAHGLQFDLAPDGQHHLRLEAGLMIYDREGRPLNWLLRQINLNLNAARYAVVQANGVNLYLKIDGPESGVSLQSGVYDLSTNLVGTLEIPLNRIAAVEPMASSKQ